MTSEKALQDKCIRWLKNHRNFWFLNVHGSGIQTGGVPDLLICRKGKFVAVELKRPDGKGKLHPRQRAQINRILRAGGEAVVLDDYDEFVNLMERL